MPLLNSDLIAENIPLRLTQEQMQNPGEALKSLYTNFTLNNMREVLWDAFAYRMTAPDPQLGFFTRDDMLYYYENMIRVLEAASLIYRKPGKVL
jgi:hypothetical protein